MDVVERKGTLAPVIATEGTRAAGLGNKDLLDHATALGNPRLVAPRAAIRAARIDPMLDLTVSRADQHQSSGSHCSGCPSGVEHALTHHHELKLSKPSAEDRNLHTEKFGDL